MRRVARANAGALFAVAGSLARAVSFLFLFLLMQPAAQLHADTVPDSTGSGAPSLPESPFLLFSGIFLGVLAVSAPLFMFFRLRLRRINEEWTLTFDAVPDMMAIVDRDGRIVRANRSFAERLGRDPAGEFCRACLQGADASEGCCILPEGEGTGKAPFTTFYSPTIHAHVRVSCGTRPSRLFGGGMVVVVSDISEQVRAERLLEKNQMRSEVLTRLGGMSEADTESLYAFALKEGVGLTESKMGVLFFYDEDTQIFTPHVRYGGRLGDRAAVVDEAPYFLENTGSLGEAVRRRGPLLINDYLSHSVHRTGMSGESTRIKRYLNMPVFSGSRIVAVVGVADKEEDYDGDDLLQLRLLMEGVWRLIERADSEHRLKSHHEQVIAHQNALLLLNTSPRMDFPGWIRHCLATAAHTLAVDRAGYWPLRGGSGTVRCLVWYRRRDDSWLHTGEHALDEVGDTLELAQSGTVLALRDAAATDMLAMREDAAGDPEASSILYCAVRRDGEMAGVLALDHCGAPRAWTAEEQEFAAALGEQIALALETEERKKAERELARREAEYRLLLENHSDLVVKADMDFRLLYVNPAYCATFGKPEEELLGMSQLALVHEEDLSLVSGSLDRLRRPPHEARHDSRALTRDGWRWFSWQARGVFEHADDVSSFICVGRDITKRKHAELALQDSRAKLRAILDSSSQSFVLFDTEGVIQAFNNTASEKAQSLFHSRLELGGNILDNIPADARPGLTARIGRVLLGEAVWDEKQFTSADGEECLLGYGLHPVMGDGDRVVGVCLNLVDLTERRRMQEERRQIETKMLQAQKLESLGMLAGGISHDFNNLLLAILGNIELAMVELSPDAGVQPLLENAKTVCLRAAELCRQLMAYTGKRQILPKVLHLGSLVEEMAEILRVSISKKVTMEFVSDPGIPPVEGDPNQLSQIIMNMIINASEAIGDREGTIHLSLTAQECGTGDLADSWPDGARPPAGTYVRLEVRDNGCGMDRETLDRIFDPFFTTKFTGRGLGLAAVMGIVRAHRGVMRVSSEPGAGSAFSVLFPAVAAEAALPEKPAQSAPAPGRRVQGLVLLADDEAPVRDFGGRLLKRMGFTVLTARDGREAVELFQQRHAEGFQEGEGFALALLDVAMPHMDGMEVLQALRKVQKDLPVLLSSGYDENEITRQLAGMRHTGFIQKPYPISTLQCAIQSLLEPDADSGSCNL